jgi:hypothetical protein
LLHSIPRQELGMKALGEHVFGLFEWRLEAFSTVECRCQELRAIGGGDLFIELSQDTSRWAQIQISNKVRGYRTMSGWAEQCPTVSFYGGGCFLW